MSATSAAASRDLARITLTHRLCSAGCREEGPLLLGATRRSTCERARMRPTPAVVVGFRRPKAIFRFLGMGSYDTLSPCGVSVTGRTLIVHVKKKKKLS